MCDLQRGERGERIPLVETLAVAVGECSDRDRRTQRGRRNRCQTGERRPRCGRRRRFWCLSAAGRRRMSSPTVGRCYPTAAHPDGRPARTRTTRTQTRARAVGNQAHGKLREPCGSRRTDGARTPRPHDTSVKLPPPRAPAGIRRRGEGGRGGRAPNRRRSRRGTPDGAAAARSKPADDSPRPAGAGERGGRPHYIVSAAQYVVSRPSVSVDGGAVPRRRRGHLS